MNLQVVMAEELLDEKARKWQSLNAKRYGEKRKSGRPGLELLFKNPKKQKHHTLKSTVCDGKLASWVGPWLENEFEIY